jgi:predicted RND superfamily exporter protein
MKKGYLILIVLVFAAITIWFTTYFSGITIDEDVTRYISDGDENLALFNRASETFELNNILPVAVKWPEYWKETAEISEMTEELAALYGVRSVSSLTNSMSFESNEQEILVGSLETSYDLEEEEPLKLKAVIDNDKTLKDNFCSEDNRSILFIVNLYSSDEVNINRSMTGIYDYLDSTGRDYYLTGNPATSYELGKLSGQDTLILIPIALALIITVLLFMFRTKTGLFIPLLVVIIADVWTVGMMLVTGITMSSILLLIPIIMIGIGVDNAIHFISKYYEERHIGKSAKESVKNSYRDVGKPMILACVTTAAGLLSLLTASILPISQLGIFGSIEIGFILLTSMVLVPVLLLLLKPKARPILNEHGEMPFLKQITGLVLKHRRITVIIIILLSVLMLAQLPSLSVKADQSDFLGDDNVAIVGGRYLEDNFGGQEQISVYIQGSGDEKLYRDFYFNRAMRDIQKFSETIGIVSNSRSLTDTVADISGAFSGTPHIPGSNATMEQVFFLIQDGDSVRQITSMEKNEARAILTGSFGAFEGEIFEIVKPVTEFIDDYILSDYRIMGLDLEDEEAIEAWKGQLEQFLAARGKKLEAELFESLVLLKKETSETLFGTLSEAALLNRFNDFLEYYYMEPVDLETFRTIVENDEEGLYDEFLYQEETTLRADIAFSEIKRTYPDMKEADAREMAAYIQDEEVPVAIATTEKGKHMDINLTGSDFITSGIQEKITESQINSLMIAIIIIYILFVIQMKSFLIGIVSMIPLLLTLLFNFGFISGLGFSLNAATAVIAALMMGLGIDYAIHYLNRFRIELMKLGDKKAAILRTSSTTGRGIFSGALTTFLAFFPLSFSRASMMGQFGLISSFNVFVTTLLLFTLLPILLMMIPKEKFLK